jgi:hypothetical protein
MGDNTARVGDMSDTAAILLTAIAYAKEERRKGLGSQRSMIMMIADSYQLG